VISYLKGKVLISFSDAIILENNGVGYKITIQSDASYRADDNVEFYIHEHIREDTDDLYGFRSFAELEIFERLLSVSGVGPKAAMAIMSSGKPGEIVDAIMTENIAFFKAVSGIGSKVAARVILDLHGKVNSGNISTSILARGQESDDIFDALSTLGYKKPEVERIAAKLPTTCQTLEDKVRWCLKNLGRS